VREDDLLRLAWIADPQISPDGRRVAYVRVAVDAAEDRYTTALGIVPADGSQPARALTFGLFDSQPRWSPDGSRLAFIRGTEAGKPGQLWVIPIAGGGEGGRLTDLPKGAGNPAWSPDGRRIAFTSATNPALDGPEAEKAKPKNPPGRIVARPMVQLDNAGALDAQHSDHLWIVELGVDGLSAAGAPRALTNGPWSETEPAFAPDGRRLYFLSDRRHEPWFGIEDQDLWSVDPERAEPTSSDVTLVADAPGAIQRFAVDADGRILAAGNPGTEPPRSYDQPVLFLFAPPWPARAPRVLPADYDFEVGASSIASDVHPPRGGGNVPLAFVEGGKAALTVVSRHGACLLARVGLDDGTVTERTPRDREVIAGTVAGNGARAALVLGDTRRPGVLYGMDVASGVLTELVDPNRELFATAKTGAVEEFWYDSFDGRKIQGWIVTPPGFDPAKKYPLVLQIHGGPDVAYGVGFFHEFQVLAEAGYVVLYVNPRGSTTYGQEFGNVIQFRYPGDDWKDLMAGVDAVLARGFVDEARMGVTGGSGGGLLTNWTVVNTDRFKAAITQRCVADWASFWYGADFSQFTHAWFRGAPHDDPADFAARSPLTFARKAKTPLLVVHSENDWRTPIVQGEGMFRAMLLHRVPTAMIRFPGEGHELSRSGTPSRRVQNQVVMRRWFDRWLQGKEAPEFDDPLAVAQPVEAQGAKAR
jgi:dipeptidyl aminopeptidase/acylaminoacyl peptidase